MHAYVRNRRICICFSPSTRRQEKHDGFCFSRRFTCSKFIREKRFFCQKLLWPFWPRDVIEVMSILTIKPCKGTTQDLSRIFCGLLPIIVFEIMLHFWRNVTFHLTWPLMTSGDLNISLSEKMVVVFLNVLNESNGTFFTSSYQSHYA